jgi:hypothetical protein
MKLSQIAVEGIPVLIPGRRTCETRALIKSAKVTNRDAPERTMRPLQRVYTGPFGVPTPSGARYILTFTDDCTRQLWTYLAKIRTELYERF